MSAPKPDQPSDALDNRLTRWPECGSSARRAGFIIGSFPADWPNALFCFISCPGVAAAAQIVIRICCDSSFRARFRVRGCVSSASDESGDASCT